MVCDTLHLLQIDTIHTSLNPYSIGIWSATASYAVSCEGGSVLILILLEYGLRHNDKTVYFVTEKPVLILILLEYGLRLPAALARANAEKS